MIVKPNANGQHSFKRKKRQREKEGPVKTKVETGVTQVTNQEVE